MAEPTEIVAERAGCTAGLEAGLASDAVEVSCCEPLIIRDNLPGRPTITAAELDVIETFFFADILDVVLSDRGGVPAASLRHKPLP